MAIFIPHRCPKCFESVTLDSITKDPNPVCSQEGEFIAYLTLGKGTANEQEISEGDLIRGQGLSFTAEKKSQLVLVQLNE
jgi:hypothetical protein